MAIKPTHNECESNYQEIIGSSDFEGEKRRGLEGLMDPPRLKFHPSLQTKSQNTLNSDET
jgi:hypothetical protein